MKKMMKVLALTLIAMMMLSTLAVAEVIDILPIENEQTEADFQEPASTDDNLPADDELPATGDEQEYHVAPVSMVEEDELPPVPHAEEGDAAPVPMAEGEELVEINDAPVPLSSGLQSLSVEIIADNMAPQFGEAVTLRSYVVNPGASMLSFQWQIDRGFGWEDIQGENGTEYTFNYDDTVSGCSFRVFVGVVAA